MTSVMNWLNFNRSVYFGNATSTRDFRVQLRGNRSALLFGAYLVVLIGVAMWVYAEAVGAQRMSIVDAQARLHNFYSVVMGLLAGTICLVTPALSATTVVLERQRRSLDLVFSAPVTPKYYLVGKMLSSYRYIWMMLALSLPVTATCVVLGGASWSDVLGSYLLLSTQALVLTSLSLLMSTVAPRPVSAVLWSYAMCAPYLAFVELAGMSTTYGLQSHTMQAPFAIALSPFLATSAVGTFTFIGGFEVPNWLLGLGATLLITKISLLAAGAVLNPLGKEARSLRIHGLVYMVVILAGLGYYSRTEYSFTPDPFGNLGRLFAWVFMPLFVLLPFMACYGFDGENRLKPDGVFRFRNLFNPTPATALPYLLTLLSGSGLGILFGYLFATSSGVIAYQESGVPSQPTFSTVSGSLASMFAYFSFTLALWTFFWAVGRFTSSLGLGLKAARGLQFAAFLMVCVVPVPLLTLIDHQSSSFSGGANIWSLWVFRSLFNQNIEATSEATTYAIILVLLTIPVSIYAEARLKEQLAARRARKEERQAA